ncbi:MAG: TraB/GumN family protein [Erythrobacter sp.]|nr:MAG: TraB/GumN family protein [Erythrobacter sp.]
MIRVLVTILGALWLASCGAPADSARDWPEPSPALWEVTAPGGQKGWLFGTIHSLPDDVEWRSPLLNDALAQSNILLVEATADDLASASSVFDQLSRSNDLPSLLIRFDPDERAVVSALLDRAGMSESDFAHYETWGAALLLASAIRTGDSANGTDRSLMAEHDNVFALEGARTQLGIFNALPEEEQEDLLLAVARETAAGRDEASVDAWLSGDQEAMAALAQDSLLADPELRAALLDARNLAWIEPIARAIEAGEQPLVAVGASHMLGDRGLPALLAARGYAVRRIQ